ncbi:prenyltransferase/squalene oxidase repeat-containing protein [soil metagenome]
MEKDGMMRSCDEVNFTLKREHLTFMNDLDTAIANTREHLLSLRNAAGHWEGELSSSALSTATAIVALSLVDSEQHEVRIGDGASWLLQNQNADGGWGDTSISKSNLSTTLLCWSALSLVGTRCAGSEILGASKSSDAAQRVPTGDFERASARCETLICEQVGSLEPEAICNAVVGRYGKDKTFSVPILMTCAIGGRLGEHGWKRVLPLPFELAAFPRSWFGAIGLPVVSYALPALIAIGYARFYHEPPKWWNPLRWVRGLLWSRISPMLKTLQPSTGGYLEATPLTSFVTMALASADEKYHPCVPGAVEFLKASQRKDGSWPIDTNLATWATTLSVKALVARHSNVERIDGQRSLDIGMSSYLKGWLLGQQYQTIHPFTNAAPGGWAWTELPGGVPDADDTSGALIALWHLCNSEEERRKLTAAAEAGITWLLDLQNRDGGMPTFCRGWGTLPFDRSTPEITAHALWACALWTSQVNETLRQRVHRFQVRSEDYLCKHQRADGSWIPLWFGNEHTIHEDNPVHGTAMVLLGLAATDGESAMRSARDRGLEFLKRTQHPSGGWGGDHGIAPTIEETANALTALATSPHRESLALPLQRGTQWLIEHTQNGTVFPAAPIGLYFARLWYHEKMYPVIWTLSALEHAKQALAKP